MGTPITPSELEVNPHLEEARPLTVDEFRDIASEDDETEKERVQNLPEDKQEFYNSVVELAGSINEEGLYYDVTCRRLKHGDLELVTGYRRYLACIYIGRQVTYDIETKSETDIISMIYNENENRYDLSTEDRAILIAKQMGRWDPEEQEFLEPEDVDGDSMTLAEFAQNTGKRRSAIFQQLSPLRQNEEMRNEFREDISESSFRLIEQICDSYSQQYTLAQALHRSSVDTHSSFKSSYKMAKKKTSSTEELVEKLCRRLLGIEFKNPKGSYINPEDEVPDGVKGIKKKEKELLENEKQEKKEIQRRIEKRKNQRSSGQVIPEPSSSDDQPDIEVNRVDKEETEDIDPGGSGGPDPEVGLGVLPSEEDQPYSDDELELTLDGDQDITSLVREEADERDVDPHEFVSDVLRVHFRKNGLLKDTPEVETLIE